jgi:hypothetical protein
MSFLIFYGKTKLSIVCEFCSLIQGRKWKFVMGQKRDMSWKDKFSLSKIHIIFLDLTSKAHTIITISERENIY